MKTIPYLTLNGNAEEALQFYQGVFGGKTEMTRFREMPADPNMTVSEKWADKIMHGSLTTDHGLVVYFSDTFEGMSVTTGDNITIHVEFDSEEKLRSIFDPLSSGGTVTMPVDTVFWGAVYGSLIDRFGTSWGLEYELPS